MPRRKGTHLTPDQAAALRERLTRPGKLTDIARETGIHRDTVSRYRRRLLAGALAVPVAPTPPADPVELTRLRGQIKAARAERDALVERCRRAEDLRAGILGIMDPPPAPVRFSAADPSANALAETIVLFLSDLHWGEVVDLEAMDGLNSYNLDIARARLRRYFHAVADLATRHWTGPRPDRIVLILGGDLVSGEIHAELAKTNDAKALPAVRDLAEHLAGGIAHLADAVGVPVDVISLAGNHGRSTPKPESKEAVETSYDVLVSDFLGMLLRGRPAVQFFVPPSVDATFSIYGWRVLATHGDRIGSRGGQGFIGPAATAARGFKRLRSDYAARGVHLDLILIGHFHTPLQLEEGFVNGSLPGPTEYSRDGRFLPHPARQLFLALHPRRGVTLTRWVNVGAPDEGALYEAPAIDRDFRPRFRVKSVGVPR